jgi:[ribosomal protein S5]-alanine N-acetyltransferase
MRIEIRKIEKEDARGLWKLINDKEVIKQLSGYTFPCPFEKIKKEVDEGIQGWKNKKCYAFTILFDKEIAGYVILENPSKDKKRYDIGFFVGKKFWNKGIATFAVKEVVDFGFNKLNLYRIQGDNDSDNPASGKVMKKAGMNFEGLRKHIQKRGSKFIDLELWGVWK